MHWTFAAAACASLLVGQTLAAADETPTVKATAKPTVAVDFKFQPPAVGASAEQNVTFSLDLKSTTVQGGATVDEVESKLTRRQTRSTTVLATDGGRITKARVTYRVAEQEVGGQRRGGAVPAARVAHAVAGKTYVVARAKPEDALSIADEQGRQPPEEERKLVASSMDAIGRDNVLGKFLDGRRLRTGQTIEMPADAAAKMLGFDESVGKVARFEMTLTAIENREGKPCGAFDTRIELQSPDASGQATRFHGRMVVEAATCRGVEAEFAGPVSFVENHGTAATGFQVLSVGALRVSIESATVNAERKADRTADKRNSR